MAEAAVKEVAQKVTGPAKPENPLVLAEAMLRPKSSWLVRYQKECAGYFDRHMLGGAWPSQAAHGDLSVSIA